MLEYSWFIDILKMTVLHTDKQMLELFKESLQSLENGMADLVDGEVVFSPIRSR